jgi:2,4-dienoyl-CoA reductase-like NADH-dependent reductase (Old Yellow Enzyme family)
MPRLLDPLKVGSIELRNRIVMPPMATNYANSKGEVTDELVKHYADRAKDLGLLIVEHSFVTHRGRTSLNQLGAYSDDLIPGLARLVDAVHENGTPVALQINHGGGTTSREITGFQPVAPSPVIHPRRGEEIPHELSLSGIEEVINFFRGASLRAVMAGFDAVEVHGAHGYLLSQFLSPLTNRRRDEFGGILENRVRLSCRIIEEIRRDLGSNFPILYRIGVDDMISGGLSLQEGVDASRMIAEKGVDILDVSGGIGGGGMEDLEGPGYFVSNAAVVRDAVDIPVIGVGGIQTVEEADEIIRSGRVDLVAVGRAMLKDPIWAKRATCTFKTL